MWECNGETRNEQEFLVNPSRTAMQEELGTDLRALLDDKDDLWVWRTEDSCHFEFARKHNLTARAWLYIDPRRQTVRVSTYSHGLESKEATQHIRQHSKFKFFTVLGTDGEPEKLDEVTDLDRALLANLGVEIGGEG